MLVDDDPTQLAILTAYFTAQNVETIKSATKPHAALETVEQYGDQVDLVVSDLQMPEMDGLEFLRHLSENKYTGKVALISGVQETLLEHAGRLAKLHSLNLIGSIKKPLTKNAMDAIFCREADEAPRPPNSDFPKATLEEFDWAMATKAIKVHYEPKIALANRSIIGAEALARWQLPSGRNVPPDQFVDMAERNGRIDEFTFYVLDRILEDMPNFLAHNPNLKISVNLTPNNIKNVSLPDEIGRRLSEAGIVSKNVSFEVTENSVLDVDTTTLEVLSRLRILGFELAIDDFGTGSANIQALRDFPYSELKIDRSFISNAVHDSFSRETVYAAVKLAQEQGMRIVAEGVEDIAKWNLLHELKVVQAQGFLFSKPISAKDFLSFLSSNPDGIKLAAA